jgi:hypothetical protein
VFVVVIHHPGSLNSELASTVIFDKYDDAVELALSLAPLVTVVSVSLSPDGEGVVIISG